MSDKPISPLRQRMIDDMTARRYGEKVQKAYVRHVRTFAAFLGQSPDTATSDDLRRFQLHMAQQQISPGSINAAIAALRFFFTVTLERPDLVRPLTTVNKPRKAPVVLSQEEVARLLEAAPGLKYKAALSVAYGAGLRVSEVANLKVSDIDSQRMMLRVEQGKGQRDRYVMLSPQLLELLRDWWHAARPQVWIFPGQNPINPTRRHRRQKPGRNLQAHLAAYPAAQLRHTSARAGRRYSRDPGVVGPRQVGDDRALHARRRQHGPRRQEPAGAAGRQPHEANAVRLTEAAWRGPAWRSPTFFAPMGRRGARPTPVT
jgi:integrase